MVPRSTRYVRSVVIVTGSRQWKDREEIRRRLSRYPIGTILIHGAAPGADSIAESLTPELGMIPVPHPYFSERGKAGGPIRNALMVALGVLYKKFGYDVTVEAFPMPESRGALDCMTQAQTAGLLVLKE